jgi:hypothetical protein
MTIPSDNPSVIRIPLTQGKIAIVDATMYSLVSAFRYFASRREGRNNWYAVRNDTSTNRLIFMHNDIMPLDPPFSPDHINRDTLDNRLSNLRPATPEQQAVNRGPMKHNSSGYRGVSYFKHQERWTANLHHKGKRVFFKYTNTPEEAARFYDAAAIKYHGEFAVLNFPEEHGR